MKRLLATVFALAMIPVTACFSGPDELVPPPQPPPDAAVDAPVDSPIDAAPDAPDGATVIAPYDPDGLPDIVLAEAAMASSWFVSSEFFTDEACELVEQCIGGTGLRRLLRFDTATGNAGARDITLGPVPPEGVNEGIYEWSACHGHHHMTGYADYKLVGGGGVVASGHKQAFCLMDIKHIDGSSIPGFGYHCGNQGISRGWEDVYGAGLPCQWVDITDVPPGTYTLQISINDQKQIEEMNYENNSVTFDVTF